MSERPGRYSSRANRPARPSLAEVEASLGFMAVQKAALDEPAPETPRQDAPAAPGRDAMVKRLLGCRADWACLAGLILEVQGPGALSDAGLELAVRLADTLEQTK